MSKWVPGIAVVLANLVAAVPLAAQEISASVPAAIECMHDSIEKRLSRSHCRTGVYSVENIMYGWFRFDEATVDGTARALVARLDSPDLEVRLRAAVLLAMMGVESDRGAGRPGSVEYLEEGYDLAEHADTRRTLVDMISIQSDRRAAAWLLGRVVAEPGRSGDEALQVKESALIGLRRLGPAGTDELRELFTSESVDPWLHGYIERFFPEVAGE